MGKNLHYLITDFFHDRMKNHSKVKTYKIISDDSEIIYQVERAPGLPSLLVHLSDEYFYSIYNYYARPSQLSKGGFILIARPEANFDSDIIALAENECIGIGKIGKLLGALNFERYWHYQEPDSNSRKRI